MQPFKSFMVCSMLCMAAEVNFCCCRASHMLLFCTICKPSSLCLPLDLLFLVMSDRTSFLLPNTSLNPVSPASLALLPDGYSSSTLHILICVKLFSLHGYHDQSNNFAYFLYEYQQLYTVRSRHIPGFCSVNYIIVYIIVLYTFILSF